MRSLEPAYAWSMSTTFHTQRVFDGKTVEVPQLHFIYKKCRGYLYFVPVFQNVQEIVEVPMSQCVDRIFDVKAMLQFQVPTSHVVQWTEEAVSPRSYVSACFFIARSPYLLFQTNPADAVPVVLQSQALLIATVQKQLKFSFLLWRLTRWIRVQRRVRQFHVFVIPTFSQPYCVHTSDPFGFLLVVASRQYDKDHDQIQQSTGTWHLRQVGALCIEGKFSSTTC